MRIKQITIDQAKQSSKSAYNPSIWAKQVDLYAQSENPVFYQSIDSDNVYVEYTLRDEGIRFFDEIRHSSFMTSAPFKRVNKKGVNKQGVNESDYVFGLVDRMVANEITKEESQQLFAEFDRAIDHYIVTFSGFWVEGKEGEYCIPNTRGGRKQMSEKSTEFGVVFTNKVH
jgi:hypothetical protein